LLARIHAQYARKGAFLTVEGSGEQWMNVIDGYLQVTQRTPQDVPFFHAVYSGYTTYFCSPENHEDDIDSFWAAQARELVWGQALGWYHPLILQDAEKCALVRRLTEFRQAHLDCFAYGTLEGELTFLDAVKPVPSHGSDASSSTCGRSKTRRSHRPSAANCRVSPGTCGSPARRGSFARRWPICPASRTRSGSSMRGGNIASLLRRAS